MKLNDVVLCNPVRTAIGTYGGDLEGGPAVAKGLTTGHDPTRFARTHPMQRALT
ncbi:hypothetical protein PEL8287_01458 [Roseovarius litorisediminis]|uniref:Thiolase N-terminal domain-containing protein n=1 Tax=Roseovarius litorisediminis TaxID=1312363 RepID=A0A1Y5S344_9RHOB|nr:hypothetical protein [Roseovarius litorisediminis]SLN31240.1 hypothetical protein PEL8287_01458 [Roseovarius litorisediminis]